MKRIIIWYSLWLKVYITKKTSWLPIPGMVILVLLISSVLVPDSENVSVGIYCEGGNKAEQITASLLEDDEIFRFMRYEDLETLYRDVTSGQLECGFILKKDLDKSLEEGKLKKSVTYIGNSMSSKGETIQEVVYARLFRVYSDEILKDSEKELYADVDEERTGKLIERNHYYQDSDIVFQLEIQDLAMDVKDAETEENVTYPIQGTVGILIFLIMFLAHGKKFDAGGYTVEKAMSGSERFLYSCMNHLAAGTVPAIAGLVLIFALSESRGFLTEIVLMVLFLIWCSVWIGVVGGWMKKSTTYAAGIATLTIANLLLCPVLTDLGRYVPAIHYISFVFPLGIYLNI